MRAGLSVVIPAYNEEAGLAGSVTAVEKHLSISKIDYEIIIVDDGSRDKTAKIADQLAKKNSLVRVIHNRPNRGYGGALKTGFTAATKDLIVTYHADGQYDFSELNTLLDKMETSRSDIVCGVRFNDRDPLYRRINRWLWNKLVYALFGHLASDIDCGFKLIRRKVIDKIMPSSNGALMDTQLLASARARGMTIFEVPVTHFPRLAGSPTGADVKVILRALGELVKYWWQLRQEVLVEQGRAVFRWEAVAICALLLLAAGLRLYRIGAYMTFLGDEGRDAIVMRDIITLRHFPLIGPGTSIGQMYLGPLYYYFTAPSLLLAGFSPVGPAVQVALVGVLTVALLWWIGRQWFGRTPALLVSTLYALSPTIITQSHSSWNPNIMPFFALLTVYGIWKVWRFGYWQWLMITAASFAMVLNSHYLGLLLVPTLGLFLILSKRKPGSNHYLLLATCVFVFLMSSLVWFDARHGWNNFAAMKQFFSDRQTTVNIKVYKSIPNLWPVWKDVVSSLVVAKQPGFAGPVAIALIIGGVYTYWKTRFRDLLFTLVWLGVGIVGLGLYKQHIYDHYYGFLFPAPFLLMGFVMERIKRWSIPVVVVLIIVNLVNSPLRTPPNFQLARTREVTGFIDKLAAGKPYNLALIAKRNYDRSYVYFLQLANSPYYTIHQKLTDQLFVICEDPVCEPINNPLWEIAAFGWSKVDRQWEFPWGVKVLKLVHNIPPK